MSSPRSRSYTGPFHVIAFDPGGTTGWAEAYRETEDDYIQANTGELIGSHHEELWNFIENRCGGLPATHVVAESFQFRQFIGSERTGIELISCEYLGVIRLATEIFSLEYKTQTAAEAKGFISDAKLDAMGWLEKPVSNHKHQNDALRHLVKYLVVDLKIRHPITTSWRESNGDD